MSSTSTTADDLLAAILLAVSAHHGQMRKNGQDPYVVHPLRVARTVARAAIPDGMARAPLILAALLHDTLEDTAVTAAQLAQQFGAEVASMVQELTQDGSLPKAERRARMLEHCGAMSAGAKIVKLADRLDNMRDMEGMSREFIARYCDEARIMLQQMRGACPAVEREIAQLIARHAQGE